MLLRQVQLEMTRMEDAVKLLRDLYASSSSSTTTTITTSATAQRHGSVTVPVNVHALVRSTSAYDGVHVRRLPPVRALRELQWAIDELYAAQEAVLRCGDPTDVSDDTAATTGTSSTPLMPSTASASPPAGDTASARSAAVGTSNASSDSTESGLASARERHQRACERLLQTADGISAWLSGGHHTADDCPRGKDNGRDEDAEYTKPTNDDPKKGKKQNAKEKEEEHKHLPHRAVTRLPRFAQLFGRVDDALRPLLKATEELPAEDEEGEREREREREELNSHRDVYSGTSVG